MIRMLISIPVILLGVCLLPVTAKGFLLAIPGILLLLSSTKKIPRSPGA